MNRHEQKPDAAILQEISQDLRKFLWGRKMMISMLVKALVYMSRAESFEVGQQRVKELADLIGQAE